MLEIAAERLVNREVAEHFHSIIRPTKPIPEETIAIHGITYDMAMNEGRDLKEVLGDFLSFIADSVLVGHNVEFDLGFVRFYASKQGFPVPTNQTLDTCEIARRHLILPSYSLERVAQYFGVVNKRAHRAQTDVEVTRRVFLKLLDRALASKKSA